MSETTTLHLNNPFGKFYCHPLHDYDVKTQGRGSTCSSPYDGLYGVAPSERGTFFWVQVYERMEISLVEVYGREF